MTKKGARSCFQSFTKQIVLQAEENDRRPHIVMPVDWDAVDKMKDEEESKRLKEEDDKAAKAVEKKIGSTDAVLPSAFGSSLMASPATKMNLGALNIKNLNLG